ncbi:MAG: PD-(D/E)XK nuclease family protein [Bacteroidales bacterium]|nr:PD-(D/E)XK nuclease family protein [Bacteroidales bacterium]
MEKQNLAPLLEKLGTINYKYSLLKEKDKFNVFEIVRKRHDEVHLHSRFIAELLDPKGTHGQGPLFLEFFVEMIQNNINSSETFKRSFDFNELEKAKAIVEHYTGPINKNKTVGGNIDIYIKDIGESSIIIENKIYADDQENQLLRYHNYDNKGLIVYLTLYGKEPSSSSTGKALGFEVLLLSYKEDIEGWLEKCIEKSAKKPELREAIVQYQKLIHKLTGNTTSMAEFKEIYNLLAENDNMRNAKVIGDNWNKLKVETEIDFWNTLKNMIEMENKYNILKEASSYYNRKKIEKAVKSKNSNNYYYGISFIIGQYKSTNIRFKIEISSHKVYYGIIPNEVHYEAIKEIIKKIFVDTDLYHSKTWSGIKNLTPKLNFAEFSCDNTLKMCNKDYREKQVGEYWKTMQKFIAECEKAFVVNLGDNYKSVLK